VVSHLFNEFKLLFDSFFFSFFKGFSSSEEGVSILVESGVDKLDCNNQRSGRDYYHA